MAIALDAHHVASKTIHALEATRHFRDEPALFAVQRALDLWLKGEPERGLASFEYAQRLSPSDGGISYALGLLRLAVGDPRACEPLAMLAARTGWSEIIGHLSLAYSMFGDAAAAAANLHRTLSRNAPEPEPWFAALAETITDEIGSPGWCGLGNEGRITIGGPAAAWPAERIAVLLDGQDIRARPATQPTRAATATAQARLQRLALPEAWRKARRIEVLAEGRALIGSPIEVAQVSRVEGFVAATDSGGIEGWCWLPGQRRTVPAIRLAGLGVAGQKLTLRAEVPVAPSRAFAEFAQPRGFTVEAGTLAGFEGAVQVLGPHHAVLYGSPLWPHEAIDSARAAAAAIASLFPSEKQAAHPPSRAGVGRQPSIPARGVATRPTPAATADGPRRIAVVVPVYRGRETTLACLDSVLAARALDERVVVVVDGSPDAPLVADLQRMQAAGQIELSVLAVNRGFPAAANVGLGLAVGCDAVLLNSDALVPPHWLERLRDAVHGEHDIGTATPLSNDATIFSYPHVTVSNPVPDLAQTTALAALAQAQNAGVVVDVPTGHGFCMFVRAECLAETGLLREDVFAQGYAEENDFCMRARALGWRHVAVPGAFVGHAGSQSFGSTKTFLIERNLRTLNRLHPGYDALIQDWARADPLASHRLRMDQGRFEAAASGRRAVLLISHDREGGVARHVRERADRHEQAGERAIILRPQRGRAREGLVGIEAVGEAQYPNLLFSLPGQRDELLALLRTARVRFVEVHHFIGHHTDLLALIRALGCPYDVMVHDYAWFCARITLVGGNNRYCGEPSVAVCAHCVADHGARIDEDIAPAKLVERSRALLRGARTVVAPSMDTARRMERHFPIEAVVGVWESEAPLRLTPLRGGRAVRRVCVIGAIGPEKGYDILLDVARHAARLDLPLEFCMVGFTSDDRRLLDTGRVSITGRYDESEAVSLIRAQDADLAFLPAIWPETWSYVLSQAWKAGLPVVAFDIGAPAERIRSGGGGILLPLHVSAAKLAGLLLDPALFDGVFSGQPEMSSVPPAATPLLRKADVQYAAQM